MNTAPYQRAAQFWETDQMGIIHHSNYIRWFEEARIDFMNQYGIPYKGLETRGISIPVLGVTCDYIKPVRFGDVVGIEMRVQNFESTHGIRFEVHYRVLNSETSELHTTGLTRHCFTDHSMKILRLKRDYPDVYQKFMDMERD